MFIQVVVHDVSLGLDRDTRRDQHRLDAAVELVGKQVAGVGHFFQRNAVRDDPARFDAARLDVFDQTRQLALDAGLAELSAQAPT
ncbi:hypothetical protein, partial [Methyloversatilis sp.]|uniref:hypothetical protein n=1 Tax=Methyloversatilis sp. TaxID=2569862 RepID=UPI0027330030